MQAIFMIVFWSLCILYGAPMILNKFITVEPLTKLEELLLFPFCISLLGMCIVVFNWFEDKTTENIALAFVLVAIALFIIVPLTKSGNANQSTQSYNAGPSYFKKKNKDALCEELCEYCVDASEQLTSYLKEDTRLYSRCININPLDTTNVVYTLYLYGRLLSTKYSGTDVVNVISSTMSKFGANDYTYASAMSLMQFCMASFPVFLEECESEPDIDLIDAMTLFYFNLVLEDREYAYDHSDEILISPAYRKIHNYFEGIMSHPIVNENYGLQIK